MCIARLPATTSAAAIARPSAIGREAVRDRRAVDSGMLPAFPRHLAVRALSLDPEARQPELPERPEDRLDAGILRREGLRRQALVREHAQERRQWRTAVQVPVDLAGEPRERLARLRHERDGGTVDREGRRGVGAHRAEQATWRAEGRCAAG
jgi:hypothetical protein